VKVIRKSVKYFARATGYRRVLLLATLAVVSALLTQFARTDFLKISNLIWLHVDGAVAPILPGIYFGLVLAIAAYAWKRRSLLAAFVILIGTVIAWIVAWETAYYAVAYLNDLSNNAADPISGSKKLVIVFYLLAGVLGGFVGGFLTLVGISLAFPDFRTINNWSRTLLVSSLAGMCLANDTNFLPLFLVWQVSVAASIAFGWSFRESRTMTAPLRVKP
jgi:hypothetical protein